MASERLQLPERLLSELAPKEHRPVEQVKSVVDLPVVVAAAAAAD